MARVYYPHMWERAQGGSETAAGLSTELNEAVGV